MNIHVSFDPTPRVAEPRVAVPACTPGMRVYTHKWMADHKQVRFPRSKKHRIQKKWAKDKRNWAWTPWRKVYMLNGAIHCHPDMVGEVVRRMNEQAKGAKRK